MKRKYQPVEFELIRMRHGAIMTLSGILPEDSDSDGYEFDFEEME